MKTMILAVALAGALLVAGCGGGGSRGASMAGMPSGGEPSTPTPTTPQTYGPGRTIPLPTGHRLQTGTTIPAGGSRTVEEPGGSRTTIRCTAGSENCRVRVAEDGTVTLITGNLQIEIVGLPDIPPPTPPVTPPVTPPTRVIEPSLPTWEQLPTLVDRMNHRTELRSKASAGSSCDDGVTACQAVVKTLLANVRERYGATGYFEGRRNFEIEYTVDGVTSSTAEFETFEGHWLDNSIFIAADATAYIRSLPGNEYVDAYFDSSDPSLLLLSMGIRDTNPIRGVYRGFSVGPDYHQGSFELTYTSGATGGQLDMTLNTSIPYTGTYTWTNVSVDNQGYFDNNITRDDRVLGANKLEGSFYQGGEVGGVYSYRSGQNWDDSDSFFVYGAFGGKLVPDTP